MKPYGWKPRANDYVGRPEQLERVVLKGYARREGKRAVTAEVTMACNHNGRTCCRTCGEEVFRDPDVVWERRMSNLLDTVENPASIPEGAPGSLHRRAWELGQRLKTAVEGGNTRTNLHGGFVDADGKVNKSGRAP